MSAADLSSPDSVTVTLNKIRALATVNDEIAARITARKSTLVCTHDSINHKAVFLPHRLEFVIVPKLDNFHTPAASIISAWRFDERLEDITDIFNDKLDFNFEDPAKQQQQQQQQQQQRNQGYDHSYNNDYNRRLPPLEQQRDKLLAQALETIESQRAKLDKAVNEACNPASSRAAGKHQRSTVDSLHEQVLQQQQQELTTLENFWQQSRQLQTTAAEAKYQLASNHFSKVASLNKAMLTVAQKYKMFGDSAEARAALKQFQRNFELLQVGLGDLEASLQDKVAPATGSAERLQALAALNQAVRLSGLKFDLSLA